FLRLPGSYRLLRTFMNAGYIQMLAEGPWNQKAITEAMRLKPDVLGVINWNHAALAYQSYLARKIKQFGFVGIPLFHTAEAWTQSDVFPKILTTCDAVLVNTEHEKAFVEKLVPNHHAVHPIGVGINPRDFI